MAVSVRHVCRCLDALCGDHSMNNSFLANFKWVEENLKRFKKKPKNCIKRLRKMATRRWTRNKIKLFRDFINDLKNLS